MTKKLFLFIVVASITTVFIMGCQFRGDEQSGDTGSGPDLIFGGTGEGIATAIPEVQIHKNSLDDGSEVTFHLRTNQAVTSENGLVVLVEYDTDDQEFVHIKVGNTTSEAFEFKIEGEDVNTVTIKEAELRGTITLPKLAKMNPNSTSVEIPIGYVFQNNTYSIGARDSVTK